MKPVLMLFFVFVSLPLLVEAQTIRVTLNVAANPSPYLSDWITRKETIILTVINNSAKDQEVKLGAKVYTDATLQMETKLDQAPTFTVRPGTNIFYGEDIVPAGAVKFYGDVNTTVVRTGRLPSGSYRFCLRLLDATTLSLLSPEQCKAFTIQNYRGPQLLAPVDQTKISSLRNRLILRWSAVTPQYSPRQQYQINVMEVLEGQSPTQAFRANHPILDRTVMTTTQMIWPPDVQIDTPGTYVWSVRALDDAGKPLGNKVDGWAEPFVCTVGQYEENNGERLTGAMLAGRSRNVAEPEIIGEKTNDRDRERKRKRGRTNRVTTIENTSSTHQINNDNVENNTSGNKADNSYGNSNSSSGEDSTNDAIIITNPEPPAGKCDTQNFICTPPSAATISSQAFKDGDTVAICDFLMIFDSAPTGTNSSLNGKGKIWVPWMRMSIAVEFTEIKVNAKNEVCTGTVWATVDSSPEPYPVAGTLNAFGSNYWTMEQVKKLNEWLHDSAPERLKDLADDVDLVQIVEEETSDPVPVPIGFNNVKGVTIAVTEIKFEPTGAAMNIIAAFPVSFDHNDTLAFKGGDIPFGSERPSTTTARLELLSDVTFTGNITSHTVYEVKFKGTNGNDTGTYISWDCKGFRELFVDMDIAFPREWLLPIPDNGSDRVISNVKTHVVNWEDWLLQTSLPRCAVARSNGLELEAPIIIYDHSDSRNAPLMTFPENYTGADKNDVGFTGFYVKSANVILPENIRTFSSTSQPVKVGIHDLIINNLGVTGNVVAENVVMLDNGIIAGLSASIDTVKISMINSSFETAYMRGKIVLPVAKATESNSLTYKALFESSSGLHFTISPDNPIEAKLFADAKLTLDPTCVMGLNIVDGKGSFNLLMNGAFAWDSIKIGNKIDVSMRMKFQDMKLSYSASDGMKFSAGTWAFASPPKWIANFPVTIDKINHEEKKSGSNELVRAGLSLDVVLNLSKAKVSGRTTLQAIGAIKEVDGRYTPELIEVNITDIDVHAQFPAVKLDGMIKFYHDDPTYGSGFKGALKAVFNSIDMEINAFARFGTTTFNSSKNPYRYWGAEARVILPKPGIVFLPGLAFYGFGIGAWQKMNVAGMSAPSPGDVVNASAPSVMATSGATFTPNPTNGFGFKALTVLGTAPDPKSFNADASLLAEFSTTGGLTNIKLNLDLYAAAGLTERNEAPVYGTASVTYIPPEKKFDMNALVHFIYPRSGSNAGNIVHTGSGISMKLNIDGSTGKWFFKLGEPTNPNTVRILNAVNVQEYLMFGNNIQPQTGFLPSTIKGLSDVGVGLGFIPGPGISPGTRMGQGFAAGLTVFGGTGNKSISLGKIAGRSVAVKYGANGGFEINMSLLRYPKGTQCNGTPLGMNRWYATGGVAAWFKGYLGVHVSASSKKKYCLCIGKRNKSRRCASLKNCCLLFCNGGDFNILSIQFGARLNGGFARPSWVEGEVNAGWDLLGGLIRGTYKAKLNIGTRCDAGSPESTSTLIAEDAAGTIQNSGRMIQAINPITGTNPFPPDNSIGVVLGFTPNDAFDVFERQSNGEVVKRTFQARYTATLDSLGRASNGDDELTATNTSATMVNTLQPAQIVGAEDTTVNVISSSAQPRMTTTSTDPNAHSNASASTVPLSLRKESKAPINNMGRLTPSIDPNTLGSTLSAPVLNRSNTPNQLGEYEYRLARDTKLAAKWVKNLEDSTRYEFTIHAELWELKDGIWVEATTRSGIVVTETIKTRFTTGVSPQVDPIIVQTHAAAFSTFKTGATPGGSLILPTGSSK
ncbi:MAG: hypothetical protein KDD67_16260 [Ignavibacteriae bacterium]|nr:hypothetical protein [Ignavibacteriota bacterium]MCB9216819.1 hypothetical protein [Ignavibacteria bacterium]